MHSLLRLLPAFLLLSGSARAIDIVVDYSFDTNNFFDTPQKRAALQEVADRYSRIITSSLAAVPPSGTGSGTTAGWRIGFTHPGTGASIDVSTAANAGSDPLNSAPGDEADVYGFPGLAANTWILYAGGRPLASKGVGGTGTGLNFTSTFNDVNGPMHRGFADNTPSMTSMDLPRWGGSISFDSNTTWHFDPTTVAPLGSSDFFSTAMHEVGHALGISTSWNQFPDNGSGSYLGLAAINAYNTDNFTSLTSLSLVSPSNPHFADNTYDSFIFASGTPNTVGTVGALRQDLLMEPVADFTTQQRRFELTNVDVAALRDVGWETLAGVVPDPVQQPDNLVGIHPSQTIGDNVYGSAAGQTLTLIARRAARVSGIVIVQNDGDLADNFVLSSRAGTSLFRIVYSDAGGNVTANLVGGTYQTGSLNPSGNSDPVTVKVIPKRSKLKIVKRSRGRRIVRFRKKQLTVTIHSQSATKPAARDLSVMRVKTR